MSKLEDELDSIKNVVNTSSSQLNGKFTVIEDDTNNQNRAVVNLLESNKFKKFSIFKTIMKLTFSNFGLVLIVCFYCCIGAVMFQTLEQHEEKRLCEEGMGKYVKEMHDLRTSLLRYVIYNVTANELNKGSANSGKLIIEDNNSTNSTNSTETPAEREVDKMLRGFRNSILQIEEKYKYFGQNCNSYSRWKFFSALLFSITVITTIGYGHVTPTTWEGQLVCVCYATIGIPIFLLCLANLSSALSDVFKFIYIEIDKFNPIKRFRSLNMTETTTVKKSKFASIDAFLNDGQLATLTNEQILKEVVNLYDENVDDDVDDDDDDEDDDDEEDYQNKVQIPFLLVLFIIILYIMLGAYIFQYFENWKLTESVYFAYSSLTTMGFGDFVPGLRQNDPKSNIKLIAIAFYSLFGMAIIGMCFSLMQGVAKRTFRKIMSKLKRLFNPAKRKNDDVNMSESEKEREKQEILGRIRLLQSFDNSMSVVRKRAV